MMAVLSNTFRGVHCSRCGKPVRVFTVIANREAASPSFADDSQHLVSRVFVLRCRACKGESVLFEESNVDTSFDTGCLEAVVEAIVRLTNASLFFLRLFEFPVFDKL